MEWSICVANAYNLVSVVLNGFWGGHVSSGHFFWCVERSCSFMNRESLVSLPWYFRFVRLHLDYAYSLVRFPNGFSPCVLWVLTNMKTNLITVFNWLFRGKLSCDFAFENVWLESSMDFWLEAFPVVAHMEVWLPGHGILSGKS